ncbi:MAG: SRPBCC domain-containing protein [Bacteroidetes bacterium]|nr:MAG: SRPBCC domain-containing protein [Bacteroidota bacterium]
MKNEPFVIERILDAPIERVWRALTDNNELQQWYFKFPEFKAAPGFEFQFLGGTETKQYLHLCKVTEVVPGKKLTYSWRYEGYEGNSFVTFELFPEGKKTKIKLTHAGLETFPAANPDFDKKNFAMGWEQIIGTILPEYLKKENVGKN